MITKRNIYGTVAYRQMKAFAIANGDSLPLLVEQYVNNWNNLQPMVKVKNTMGILQSFIWSDTPEGQAYWSNVYMPDKYAL